MTKIKRSVVKILMLKSSNQSDVLTNQNMSSFKTQELASKLEILKEINPDCKWNNIFKSFIF